MSTVLRSIATVSPVRATCETWISASAMNGKKTMFEMREPIHAHSRFLRKRVAAPIASPPWMPMAGVQPANAPRNTAIAISRGDARSDFASAQRESSFCQRRPNTEEAT